MQTGPSRGVVFVAPVLPLDVAMMSAALEQAGMLDRLVTRWCFTEPEVRVARALRFPAHWLARPTSPVPAARLKRLPAADLIQRCPMPRPADSLARLDASFACVAQTAAGLLSPRHSAVLAREDSCLAAFQKAAALALPRIYHLPTAHVATVRNLLYRERELYPQAFDPASLETDFAPSRIARKLAELALATHVLCPSRFVANSLRAAGAPEEKLVTLPLAADTRWPLPTAAGKQPVFLYVGNLSARKGVHRLILAWKRLRAYRTCRLRLIGDSSLPEAFLNEHSPFFERLPRKPRNQLLPHYANAQAFLFNPVADGFGHVFAEAMLSGTAVIANRNCGAPEFIRHGLEGQLFDFGQEGNLEAALDWALSHPAQLQEMGVAAQLRARHWGWDQFQHAFIACIKSLVGDDVRSL